MVSTYFMGMATAVQELKFEQMVLEKKYVNKQWMQPLVNNHMYNLQKLTFRQVRAEDIFAVEALVQSLDKFLLVSEIVIDECCTRFTDKFFAHFASMKS